MAIDATQLPTASKGAGAISVVGQGVVGKFIDTPWLPDAHHEITQGYGQTQNTYPTNHGTVHWHSGVDIDCHTNTPVVFPSSNAGVVAKAVYLDNPGGYGTALTLVVGIYSAPMRGVGPGSITLRKVDIILGHLAVRLVRDGQIVRGGDHLGLTDCTGRCTGPHLHFEVRPPDGRYGTDLDPSSYLFGGAAAETGVNVLDPLAGIGEAITAAEQDFVKTLVGLGQTALGGTMMLAGGAMVGFGLRGRTPQQAMRATSRTATRLNRRRVERQPEPEVARPRTAAERSRLRQSLQRETGAAPAQPGAGMPLSSLSGPVSGGEERAVLRAEQAATGRRAAPGAAIRARARYGRLGRARLAS